MLTKFTHHQTTKQSRKSYSGKYSAYQSKRRTYTFDKTGNITQVTDTSATDAAKTANYTYDDLDRLTSATITNTANNDDYTRTYAYDSIGNITNKSDVGAYTYLQNNYASPHAVTQAGTQNFTYDNNGNLQTDGNWTHSWDYKDRLISSSTSGTTVSYEYDEAKTRVTKTNESTGKITTYINDLFDIEDGEDMMMSITRVK
ncbi:hypothetical protein IPN35_04875 [Candidatus Peregrinibacteria bacterium]|nr:MAG: hypothetical protein IPN35_04875 [Candidatus Peregrinibacteria bacterium]